MPFCRRCGNFEIWTDADVICKSCSSNSYQEFLNKGTIAKSQKAIDDMVKEHNLYYADAYIDSEPKQNRFMELATSLLENNRQAQENGVVLYQRSARAFSTCIFGILFLFIAPELTIFGFFLIIASLLMAIRAWRIEHRNFRVLITIILATIFILFIIIGYIAVLQNPEFLAQLESEALSR